MHASKCVHAHVHAWMFMHGYAYLYENECVYLNDSRLRVYACVNA